MATTVRVTGKIRQVFNNSKKKEAFATCSTTTPGTVAGSVGRAGTTGGRTREMIEKWGLVMNTPKKTGPQQFGLREKPTCRCEENCEVLGFINGDKERKGEPMSAHQWFSSKQGSPKGATSRVQEDQV